MDDLQGREKDEEPLLILCANCQKKHCLGKCPLSNLKVCGICEYSPATSHCPSLPQLQKVLTESSKVSNQPPGITQNPTPFDIWNNDYFPEQVPLQIGRAHV